MLFDEGEGFAGDVLGGFDVFPVETGDFFLEEIAQGGWTYSEAAGDFGFKHFFSFEFWILSFELEGGISF